MKFILLFLFFTNYLLFSQTVSNDKNQEIVSANRKTERHIETSRKLEKILSLISNRVDSLYIFPDRKGHACVMKNDTLISLRIVADPPIYKMKFEVVKLQIAPPLLTVQKHREVYENYVDLTIDQLIKNKWEFYKKKELPIQFGKYEYLLIEEYLENNIEAVIKKHF